MPFTFNFSNFGGFGQGGWQPGGQSGQDAGYSRPQRERKPRKPIGTPLTRTLINLAVTAVVGLVYFYVELPALNPHAEEFYVFVFLLCAVYCGCAVLTSGFQGTGAKGYLGFVKKQCTVPFFVVIALICAVAVGSIASWVVLRAGSYSRLLPLTTGDFASEVEEIRYNQIPMLDSDSAARLGSLIDDLAVSWASWRIWCPSLKFCPPTPKSTIRAARCGSPALPMATSSNGSPTAPMACLPISSSTW